MGHVLSPLINTTSEKSKQDGTKIHRLYGSPKTYISDVAFNQIKI